MWGAALVGICLLVGLAFRYREQRTQNVATSNEGETSTLQSFYTNTDDYDSAFLAADQAKLPVQNAAAAITSHHFLAKETIAKTILSIDPSKVKNIILVSPDHYSAVTRSEVIGVTTAVDWSTPFGKIEKEPSQIEALTTLPNIALQPTAFLNEHGIYTLIPFLKKHFPRARVTPIILRGSDTYTKYVELGWNLHSVFPKDETLLLVSSDFSHEMPAEKAQAQDEASILALNTLSEQNVDQVNSDCKVCVAVLAGYLSQFPHQFSLIEQTNSYNISGQDPERVTSYVSGVFVRTQPSSSATVTISPLPSPTLSPASDSEISLLFGGDLMFDRTIRQKMQKQGNDFVLATLAPLFTRADFVIANLEGPITNNPSKSVGSTPGSSANFIFTFDPSLAPTLAAQGVRVLNLGNNHIRNFGEDGVEQTKTYLAAAGISFFGDTGSETTPQQRTLTLEHKGLKIGLINYNQFTADGLKHAQDDIAAIRPAVDLLIVYTHWGNEYVPTANEVIQSQAHQFIDLGADLIIGSHPHVIQNVEEYKGKRIYYSLGNFVFDQYFSPETQRGLLVEVKIDPQTRALNFIEHKIQLQPNGQTVVN